MTRPGRWRRLAAVAVICAALPIVGCRAGANGPQRDRETSAGRYDLDAAEQLGGHTLARHVGRTDDDLRQRLRREPDISAASSYTDRQTAERVIGATLQQLRPRVDSWLARSGSRPNLALEYAGTPGEIVGRSLRRGDARTRPCAGALVVLRWHPRVNYYVLTSYPECSK